MPHTELNPQQLKALTNSEVLNHTKSLTDEERKITAQILRLLREIERRRIFSELGFSSVHEFCVKFLKYSEGAAYRRISAMRLLRDLPQEEAKKIEASIEQGSLSLSSVSLTHSFFQAEKNKNAKTYSPTEKKEILKTLEGKSKKDAERILMGISPRALTQEKERALTNDKTQIQFVADAELLEKFKKIQQLASHTLTRRGGDHKSYEALFEYMADMVLEKIDPRIKPKIKPKIKMEQKINPEKKQDNKLPTLEPIPSPQKNAPLAPASTSPELPINHAQKPTSLEKLSSPVDQSIQQFQNSPSPARPLPSATSATHSLQSPTSPEKLEKTNSRFVPITIRQALWQRSQGQCEYVHTESGRRCETKSHLEIDHQQPYCLGGQTVLNNLRVLCSNHNKTVAIQILGQKKMQRYLPTLR